MIVLENGAGLPDGTQVVVLPEIRAAVEPSAESAPLADKLLDLARWAESQPTNLPEDLAANHDHYFHGLPKRQ